jgi:HSP20 family protein
MPEARRNALAGQASPFDKDVAAADYHGRRKEAIMKALTTRRWGADITPWKELEDLTARMQHMFEPAFKTSLLSEPVGWMPAVELVEEDSEFLLTAELPGIPVENVDVSIEDNVLTLKGEKKAEEKFEKGRRHIVERSYGAFERSFTLPRNVEPEKIRAEFKDGIVLVHIPKGDAVKPRHIQIKGA